MLLIHGLQRQSTLLDSVALIETKFRPIRHQIVLEGDIIAFQSPVLGFLPPSFQRAHVLRLIIETVLHLDSLPSFQLHRLHDHVRACRR